MSGVRLALASCCLMVVLACGGGGGGGGPTTIGGTIDTVDFEIPAGETRLLSSDLRVHASRSIKIAGKLLVPPGMSYQLYCDGDVTLDGSIEGVESATGQIRSPQDDGGHTGDVDGVNVTLNGDIRQIRGASVYITTTGSGGKLTINGRIHGGDGLTSTTPGQAGQDGGSVQIGTQAAIDRAHANGRPNDVAFSEVLISAEALLSGGYAGWGYNDNSGDDQGATLVASCSSGGKGGDVLVVSTGLLTNSGVLQGGYGGAGGSIQSLKPGRDGVNALEKGQNVEVVTGHGGNGGSAILTGQPVAGSGSALQGPGGGPGGAMVAAGNGGPGAPGGDVQVTIGKKGQPGQGTAVTATPRAANVVVKGGNGGEGHLPGIVGGDGGKCLIRGFQGTVPYISSIDAEVFGNGGIGASGCIEFPFSAGAKGGKGFAIDSSGSGKAPRLTRSLRGGDGGSGDGPGQGGVGPGGNGNFGIPCDQVELAVVLTKPLGTFKAGEVVPVAWFQHGHVARPEFPISTEHGYRYYHFHANAGELVTVTDRRNPQNPVTYGPYPDPDANHGGFGRVIARRKI